MEGTISQSFEHFHSSDIRLLLIVNSKDSARIEGIRQVQKDKCRLVVTWNSFPTQLISTPATPA